MAGDASQQGGHRVVDVSLEAGMPVHLVLRRGHHVAEVHRAVGVERGVVGP